MKNSKNCHCESAYPSHEKELGRLNRALCQIEVVKKMIEARRYCPEILIQLKAVRSAIKTIESNILKSYLSSCVDESFANGRERDNKIDEIKDLLDRFQS